MVAKLVICKKEEQHAMHPFFVVYLVSKQLMEEHQQKRLDICKHNLDQYSKEGKSFLKISLLVTRHGFSTMSLRLNGGVWKGNIVNRRLKVNLG